MIGLYNNVFSFEIVVLINRPAIAVAYFTHAKNTDRFVQPSLCVAFDKRQWYLNQGYFNSYTWNVQVGVSVYKTLQQTEFVVDMAIEADCVG